MELAMAEQAQVQAEGQGPPQLKQLNAAVDISSIVKRREDKSAEGGDVGCEVSSVFGSSAAAAGASVGGRSTLVQEID